MKIYLSLMLLVSLIFAGCSNDVAVPPNEAGTAEAKHADAEHSEDEHAQGEHADEERSAGTIVLSAEQMRNADIDTAQAGSASVRTSLALYGVITPNAERVREVTARYPGTILSVNRKVGDTVAEGDALMVVESNESLQRYTIPAPLSGVITARNANPGEQTGDKSLFTVADLASVWVELALFPRDVGKVAVGQSVRVTSTDAGLSGTGQVVYVAPIGTAASQTLSARVLLENTQRQWAPGLYVTAEVTLSEVEVPVAVRAEALQVVEGSTVVFVQGEDGFAPRRVVLGRADREYQEILEGISAGESYVTHNSFTLKAELGKGEAEHGH